MAEDQEEAGPQQKQGRVEVQRNPFLKRQMGQTGQKRASEFDVRTMVAKIAALYEELLQKKGLPTP